TKSSVCVSQILFRRPSEWRASDDEARRYVHADDAHAGKPGVCRRSSEGTDSRCRRAVTIGVCAKRDEGGDLSCRAWVACIADHKKTPRIKIRTWRRDRDHLQKSHRTTPGVGDYRGRWAALFARTDRRTHSVADRARK